MFCKECGQPYTGHSSGICLKCMIANHRSQLTPADKLDLNRKAASEPKQPG